MNARPDVLRSFAEIPTEIRRRVAAGERVALVLLDALGLALLHRHEDQPLLRRLQISPLASQLPSTTTAHVTTMHFGEPVQEHGLYEWNILEPALGEVICPLRFNLAGSGFESLAEGLGTLSRAALDAVQERLAQLRGVTVLLCADHGQVDVSPERATWLPLSSAQPSGCAPACGTAPEALGCRQASRHSRRTLKLVT